MLCVSVSKMIHHPVHDDPFYMISIIPLRYDVYYCYVLDNRVGLLIVTSIGKASISASFSIVYLLATEVFPTVLRTVGLGMSSMCARAGGILAPYIAMLVSRTSSALIIKVYLLIITIKMLNG